MSEPVRVPDPVYSKATTEAERQDVTPGVIIQQWMEDAQELEEYKRRNL